MAIMILTKTWNMEIRRQKKSFILLFYLWYYYYNYHYRGKNSPANAGAIRDVGLIPGLGRSPGGGHGNPPQYSHLENSTDRRAWWATVYGVTESWTWLKWLSRPCLSRKLWDNPPPHPHHIPQGARWSEMWVKNLAFCWEGYWRASNWELDSFLSENVAL